MEGLHDCKFCIIINYVPSLSLSLCVSVSVSLSLSLSLSPPSLLPPSTHSFPLITLSLSFILLLAPFSTYPSRGALFLAHRVHNSRNNSSNSNSSQSNSTWQERYKQRSTWPTCSRGEGREGCSEGKRCMIVELVTLKRYIFVEHDISPPLSLSLSPPLSLLLFLLPFLSSLTSPQQSSPLPQLVQLVSVREIHTGRRFFSCSRPSTQHWHC